MLLGAKHTQAKFTPVLSTAAASFLPRNTQHHQVRHKVPAKGTHLEKVQIYFPNGRGLCITYSWSIKGINRWYQTKTKQNRTEQDRKTAPIATCSTKEPTKRLFFLSLSGFCMSLQLIILIAKSWASPRILSPGAGMGGSQHSPSLQA